MTAYRVTEYVQGIAQTNGFRFEARVDLDRSPFFVFGRGDTEDDAISSADRGLALVREKWVTEDMDDLIEKNPVSVKVVTR